MSQAIVNLKKLVPPVFMFGFERSGTTLLSMMVGAHPDIAVPLSVTGLWYRYGRNLNAYGQLVRIKDVEHMVDDLLNEERIKMLDVEFSRNEILNDLELGSFAVIVERFHSLYASYKNKSLWGNIDIATLNNMDMANNWFPDARFLHIVRDGRDVALSHETYVYGTDNTLECAERWLLALRVNLKMGSILGDKRYMIVRYEDLILESETTLQRICKFLGLPYSSAMLDYSEMVDKKVPKDRRFLWPILNQKPIKSKAYRWKDSMSNSRRMVFEGVANELLKELGYEAYDKIPKFFLGYIYELWCSFNRGGRIKRLAAKLGINRNRRK